MLQLNFGPMNNKWLKEVCRKGVVNTIRKHCIFRTGVDKLKL